MSDKTKKYDATTPEGRIEILADIATDPGAADSVKVAALSLITAIKNDKVKDEDAKEMQSTTLEFRVIGDTDKPKPKPGKLTEEEVRRRRVDGLKKGREAKAAKRAKRESANKVSTEKETDKSHSADIQKTVVGDNIPEPAKTHVVEAPKPETVLPKQPEKPVSHGLGLEMDFDVEKGGDDWKDTEEGE